MVGKYRGECTINTQILSLRIFKITSKNYLLKYNFNEIINNKIMKTVLSLLLLTPNRRQLYI